MPGTEQKEQQVEEEELQLARQLLTKIYCRDDWVDNKEAHGRVLDLLKIYPSFASRPFQLSKMDSKDIRVPLYHFLLAGADLEIIKAVYNLYPDAIKTESYGVYVLPHHFACHTAKGTAESIAFLIEQYPEALDVTESIKLTPIACFLKRCERQIGNPPDWEVLSNIWDLLVHHGQVVTASMLELPLRKAFRSGCVFYA